MFVDFLFSICLLVVFSCSRLAFEYTWDCETGYSARSGLMTARDAKMSHDTGKQWACICMNPSGVGFGEWHILTATKSSWVYSYKDVLPKILSKIRAQKCKKSTSGWLASLKNVASLRAKLSYLGEQSDAGRLKRRCLNFLTSLKEGKRPQARLINWSATGENREMGERRRGSLPSPHQLPPQFLSSLTANLHNHQWARMSPLIWGKRTTASVFI